MVDQHGACYTVPWGEELLFDQRRQVEVFWFRLSIDVRKVVAHPSSLPAPIITALGFFSSSIYNRETLPSNCVSLFFMLGASFEPITCTTYTGPIPDIVRLGNWTKN